MSVLELKRINKYFGKEEAKQQVLKEICLRVEEGEMLSVMGTSGSGKSTLLNILGLLDLQSEGMYFFENKEINQLKEEELAQIRNQKIGFVFQRFHLVNELTALENVQLNMTFSNLGKKKKEKKSPKEMKKRSLEILTSLGMEKHIYKIPSQLSGGQQQRVAIARALANDPKIILADEPTGALDQKNSKEIMGILTELNKKGKIIIIVTHDKKVATYCKRHFLMEDGILMEKSNQ